MKDKHKHYIIENSVQRFGRFTIVQVKDKDGKRAIGIARRSDEDAPSSIKGHTIARGRAERALAYKKKKKKINHTFMG